MEKKINYNLRFIRNVAIFLVVLTHVSSWQMFYQGNQTLYYMFQSISQLGCPIFLMISGAFLLNPQKEEPCILFLKRRVTRVLIPFIFWSYVSLIWQDNAPLFSWQRSIDENSISYNPLLLFKNLSNSTYWFLLYILGLYLMIPILKVLRKNGLTKYLYILLIVDCLRVSFSNIFGISILNDSFQSTALMRGTIYLMLGCDIKNWKNKNAISIISLIIGLLGTFFLLLYRADVVGLTVIINDTSPFILLASIGLFYQLNQIKLVDCYKNYVNKHGGAKDYSFGIFFTHIFVLHWLSRIKFNDVLIFDRGGMRLE